MSGPWSKVMTIHAVRILGATLSCALFAAGVAHATSAVPAVMQAAIVSKVVGYDPAIAALKRRPRVLVIDTSEGDQTRQLAEALGRVGMDVSTVTTPQLAADEINADLVFVMMDDLPDGLLAIIANKKLLSVSVNPSHVMKGRASLSMELDSQGFPKILVSLRRLKAEGHSLSSDVLALARLYD